MRIDVAQIRVSRTFRGLERYVLNVCADLRSRGLGSILITDAGGSLVEAAAEQGVPCVELPIRGDLNLHSPARLASALKHERIDLVNIHGGHAALLCSLGAKLAKVPSICTVHIPPSSRLRYSLADHIVTVSEALRNDLVSRGLDSRRVSLVRNGIDTERFKPGDRAGARRDMNLPQDRVIFAFAGAFVTEKGVDLLIEAFAEAHDADPRIFLLLAGEGPLEDRLRARVSELGLQDDVTFPGYMADVRPAIWAADCMVLASSAEGFPLAILEALACGRPMIATDTGDTRLILEEGVNGLPVPLGNRAALRDAMLRMASSPEEAAEFGRRGRDLVVREYSWEKQMAELLDVYERVLARGK